jgi:hypothetical protein
LVVGAGVTVDELCFKYPLVWHMAEDGTWPSIAANGLLSTSALLDLYGYAGETRAAVESHYRPTSVSINAHGHPTVVIRDQGPIHEPTLRRVLTDGLQPSDWYRMLNERVFFWVSERRLETLLQAKRYRDSAHTIVVVDTRKLLNAHEPDVTLCPMNSGNTMMIAMPRGTDTFAPLASYPYHERRKAGLEPVVELAVKEGVANIETVAVRAERRASGASPSLIWRP